MHEGEYSINAIYAYDEGIIIPVWCDMERAVNLYSNGIIESIWGATGRTYYIYYQLQKNSGLIKFQEGVSVLTSNWVKEQGEEKIYYRQIGKSLSEEVVIEENEFYDIVSKYESIQSELEWKLLEGFWNPESTDNN